MFTMKNRRPLLREAEGYERLTRAKADTTGTKGIISESDCVEDIFSDGMQHGEQKSEIWDIHPRPSAVNVSVQQASPDDSGDKIDMFGDEENANENLPVPSAEQADQPTSGSLGSSQDLGSGAVSHGGDGNDYVYDETSGYYYSSSLGYYYDPTSGMYCCGATGTWYTFDEHSGTYTEIQSSTTES